MTTPYTYLIGWTNQRMFYYGVQWKRDCSPSNLWSSYFTSSKHVKAFRALYGEPDIISIRKTFSSSSEARTYESKVLKRMRCGSRADFLNVTEQPCPSFRRKHSEETKAKMRTSAQRLPRSDEVKAKISAGNKGKPKSAESIIKMRKSLTGRTHTKEAKANMAASRIGLKLSAAHRAKISASNTGGNHHHAKPCIFDGQYFECLKDASDFAGLSKHLTKKHPAFKFHAERILPGCDRSA